MPNKNRTTRDQRIYDTLPSGSKNTPEQFSAQHIFSRDPKKTSTLSERGGSVFYAKKHIVAGETSGEKDQTELENTRSAVIFDTIITDDPKSSIPYLQATWISSETKDLALTHKLFSKVREK